MTEEIRAALRVDARAMREAAEAIGLVEIAQVEPASLRDRLFRLHAVASNSHERLRAVVGGDQ